MAVVVVGMIVIMFVVKSEFSAALAWRWIRSGADHWRCGSQNQPAGLNALAADQVVCQHAHLTRRAAEQDHLQAAIRVEMDVRRGDDLIEMAMLQFGQALGDPAGVMIIDERHDAHGLAVLAVDHLFDKRRSHESADRLAPVGISVFLTIAIEPTQELATDRDAEADKWIFH
jgi:hypothetical protein